MNRKLLLSIGAVVVSIILISVVVISADKLLGGDRDNVILIDFDTGLAAAHVKELVQWGPRMTGSEAERNGAEYIAAAFTEVGLSNVDIEGFYVPMFSVEKAKLSIVEYYPLKNVPKPLGRTETFKHIEEFVLQGYSGSYRWNSFRDDLDVVNIGNGTDESAYGRTNGRICFIEQTADTPRNSVVHDLAYRAGARAIILQNVYRNEELGFLPMFKTNQYKEDTDSAREIPFMMVSKACGDRILEATSANFKVRMDIDVLIQDRCVNVVVGDLPGRTKDMVIFGAHYDTCYNTIGVVDNTVGPATLIEIARGMVSEGTPDKTIRFCTFAGEEEGLFGSINYFDAHKREFMKDLDLYINFDMAHVDPDTNSFTITTTDNSTISTLENIRDTLVRFEPALEKYEIEVVYNDMTWAASDHWAFVNGGHDAMGGWGSGCVEYHTYLDNLDHLNPESLQIGGRILGSYAYML